MAEEKIAREIEDCDGCPLYGNDCPGGWTGGPNGPIEPPCCSWNGDEEISEGMYSNITYLPQELKWRQEAHEQKEAEKRAAKHKEEIENLELRVWNLTGDRYRHIERKYAGELSDRWRCPYCHGWTRVTWASGRAGIDEAWCGRCGRRMVYCQELEDELEGQDNR